MDRVYLGIFYTLKALVVSLPFGVLKPILHLFADTARLFNKKHKNIIMTNLNLAYEDEMSEEEKKRILKECYRNLALNAANLIKNQRSTKDELLKKVTFENEEVMKEAISSGRPIILQAAHYGNWELLGLALSAKYGPASVVGRPLDSKAMDELLMANRELFDVKIINKKGAMKPMLKAIKEGRMLGLLVDQSPGEKQGILVDFFGKKVRHTHGASLIARKTGAIIIPVFIHTFDHKHFTIRFYSPIEVAHTKDVEKDILDATQAQASVTEKAVRAKPDEWFWFHKRWKSEYSHMY